MSGVTRPVEQAEAGCCGQCGQPIGASPTEERRVLARGWVALDSNGWPQDAPKPSKKEAWLTSRDSMAPPIVYVEVVAVPPGEE